MKFEVKYDPNAEDQLDKLQKDISIRIIMKLKSVGETGKGIDKLKEEEYGYKIRIGEYRILIDLTYNSNIIWVRHIDTRGRIYKRI